MIPFKRAMVVSYRLSSVTIALSLTIWPQFAIECLPMLKSTEGARWVTFAQSLERKVLANLSQIVRRFGIDMGLSYAKDKKNLGPPFWRL